MEVQRNPVCTSPKGTEGPRQRFPNVHVVLPCGMSLLPADVSWIRGQRSLRRTSSLRMRCKTDATRLFGDSIESA